MTDVQSVCPHHTYEIQFHMGNGKIRSWGFDTELERNQVFKVLEELFIQEL